MVKLNKLTSGAWGKDLREKKKVKKNKMSMKFKTKNVI